METPATHSSAIREALRGLIDYAGLFPPARLGLAEAIDEYRSASAGPHAWMLGGFIVPLSLLAARAAELGEAPLCIILDGDGESGATSVARLRDEGLRVEALELPLGPACNKADTAIEALRALREALERERLSNVRIYVELPRDAAWNELLAATMPEMQRLGLRAKLRCGGLTAGAFPNCEEVAAFLLAACAAGVPFKATAGLHHPVRHRDAKTGFYMHGFLNLLTAAALAPCVDSEALHGVVGEEDVLAFSLDENRLRWRSHEVNAELLAQTRRRFVSYGSCSFAEPVTDLIALGMLAP